MLEVDQGLGLGGIILTTVAVSLKAVYDSYTFTFVPVITALSPVVVLNLSSAGQDEHRYDAEAALR